ncbi:MAG TPA: hypothetical protein VFN25_06370 [Dokdonella sp.]|uniref:hypothetical protein n=1 Tax=Dokdonella sp. TaxID=2291710 RepID=UPI002D811497|nr:hypothetical protein [Dokdonella sp.]HET9032513.1 hypothetical protein [Dokdonella sp.]
MKIVIESLILGVLILAGTQVMAQDNQGEVIVRSAGTGYTPSGPAPEFSQLDTDGNGSIDHHEASGYKLLANDFRMADSNHDGKISRREYERWAALP